MDRHTDDGETVKRPLSPICSIAPLRMRRSSEVRPHLPGRARAEPVAWQEGKGYFIKNEKDIRTVWLDPNAASAAQDLL